MIIDKETNEIVIRLGNDYKYINRIIFNDGTVLVNAQCTLIAPTTTTEELQEFKNKVKGNFKSDHKAEFKNLKMLGLV